MGTIRHGAPRQPWSVFLTGSPKRGANAGPGNHRDIARNRTGWPDGEKGDFKWPHSDQLKPRPYEDIERDGPTVFAHACKLGLEGAVALRPSSRSGRRSSPFSSMRSNAYRNTPSLARW